MFPTCWLAPRHAGPDSSCPNEESRIGWLRPFSGYWHVALVLKLRPFEPHWSMAKACLFCGERGVEKPAFACLKVAALPHPPPLFACKPLRPPALPTRAEARSRLCPQGSTFGHSEIDFNPGVLLEDMNHPWVYVYLGVVKKCSSDCPLLVQHTNGEEGHGRRSHSYKASGLHLHGGK